MLPTPHPAHLCCHPCCRPCIPSSHPFSSPRYNGQLLPPIPSPTSSSPPTTTELGLLWFSPEDSSPICIIGTHELKGTIVKLKNPYLVCQKRGGAGSESVTVKGVVTTKYLFDSYPKTIMRAK